MNGLRLPAVSGTRPPRGAWPPAGFAFTLIELLVVIAIIAMLAALLVAMYSWLLLAGLQCYGPTRTKDYEPLPKWRKGAKRPSCLDLVTLLRKQIADKPPKFATAAALPTYQNLVTAAAA